MRNTHKSHADCRQGQGTTVAHLGMHLAKISAVTQRQQQLQDALQNVWRGRWRLCPVGMHLQCRTRLYERGNLGAVKSAGWTRLQGRNNKLSKSYPYYYFLEPSLTDRRCTAAQHRSGLLFPFCRGGRIIHRLDLWRACLEQSSQGCSEM